jgi:hypothetical protein
MAASQIHDHAARLRSYEILAQVRGELVEGRRLVQPIVPGPGRRPPSNAAQSVSRP